jgi:hypothetical protein
MLFAALVLLPIASAAAQRSRATKRDPAVFADDAILRGPAIRGRDLEELSPIKLFIDKRKDLKLSDAQLDGLKKADETLKEQNKPLYKAIDSLAREMRPPMNSTPESQNRIREARRDLETTISTIHETYDAASKDAVGTFDADQQTKANELLAKLKEDGQKRIRDKMKTGR